MSYFNLRPTFGETAIVTHHRLKFRVGKWRVYDVRFETKYAILITDHEVRDRYSRIGRITNYKFIALEEREDDRRKS